MIDKPVLVIPDTNRSDYLDGGKTYKLSVPLPVPAKLFWSVTVYDPEAPKDKAADGRWIQTIPDRGWFAYFRVYGPEKSAFDGNWKPADFEKSLRKTLRERPHIFASWLSL